ncbi:MAG: TonB-dependent receptor [Nitrospiraceae bacterium]
MKSSTAHMQSARPVIGVIVAMMLLPGGRAWADESAGAGAAEEIPMVESAEVMISATRTPTSVGNVNQAVTIVTEEQLQQQIAASPSRSLTQILTKLVPGMSQNDQSMDSGTSLKIRGRSIAIMIDGVPQQSSPTTELDLAHIDPSAIERIEIIRGATAIYGNGATGGLINIITKQPGEGKPSYYTEVQGSGSLTRVLRGLSGTVVQGFQGKKDWFDYNIVGSFSQQGGMFDANGSRTMPGTNTVGGFADTKSYNIMSKFGATFGDHRLQLTFNRKESRQDTNYLVDPNVDALPRTFARYVPGLSLADQPKLANTQIRVDFPHPHPFVNRVHLQGYYRTQQTRFPTLDSRLFGGTDILQGYNQSDVLGTRLDITTPIPIYGKPEIVWGMDFSSQHGAQSQSLFDQAVYDGSGGRVYSKNGEVASSPSRVFNSTAVFAQGEWTPLAALILRGGVRHERVKVSSSDFTGNGSFLPASSIDFDTTVFNAGFVYHLLDPLDVFFNFSQGFSVPVGSIDNALGNVPSGTAISLSRLQPQRVNNYELGVRGKWSKVQASLSGYISKSSLGLNFDQFTNSLRRAPQTIYGVEATLDVQPIERRVWAEPIRSWKAIRPSPSTRMSGCR